MIESGPTTEAPPAPVDAILQRVRTIAVISTLSAFVVGVLVLLGVLLSFYPSVRATLNNLERVSAAMAVSAESFAGVSDETAQNLASASTNLNAAAVNINNASANFERNSKDDNIAQTIIRLLEQQERQVRR